MEICGPKGRDCIERNSSRSFNCSTTCEGIYADVQWVGKKIEEIEGEEAEEDVETEFRGKDDKLLKRLADLEKEMKLLKSSGQERGEEMDKQKYKKLIDEYRKFKRANVKHFRFNSGGNTYAFGKVPILSFVTTCHSEIYLYM